MLSLINEIQKRDGTKVWGREIEIERERGKTIKSVERARRDKKKSAKEKERGRERADRSGRVLSRGWVEENISVHIQRL